MTGLSKELITCIKRSSSHSSETPSVKHPSSQRFKACMEQETPSSEDLEQDLDEDKENPLALCAPGSFSLSISSNTQASAISGSAIISCADIEALFEKMASTMLVMHTEGEQETTLFLDSPQFSSSSLFGTRITIKEFSTAPKVFNIEIASHQAGLHLLATHKDALVAAFESHRLPFSVHRLDLGLQGAQDPEFYPYPGDDDQQEQKEDER
jgi:hypothetical protein